MGRALTWTELHPQFDQYIRSHLAVHDCEPSAEQITEFLTRPANREVAETHGIVTPVGSTRALGAAVSPSATISPQALE